MEIDWKVLEGYIIERMVQHIGEFQRSVKNMSTKEGLSISSHYLRVVYFIALYLNLEKYYGISTFRDTLLLEQEK